MINRLNKPIMMNSKNTTEDLLDYMESRISELEFLTSGLPQSSLQVPGVIEEINKLESQTKTVTQHDIISSLIDSIDGMLCSFKKILKSYNHYYHYGSLMPVFLFHIF